MTRMLGIQRHFLHGPFARFRMGLHLALGILVVTLGIPAAGAQEATPDASSESDSPREVLGTGLPEVAPGYELVLTRVVLPAGTTVPAHFHPGMQVVAVESGAVHFTVVSGEVPYTRAGDGMSGVTEGTLGPGETMEFVAGDWFVETPGTVHIAENRGDTPAVVMSSSLFPTGVPSAIPAESE